MDENRDLLKAILNKNAAGVRQALDRGADPNARFGGSSTAALHSAAGSGNPELVATLLEAGANPNLRDAEQGTPLLWAATDGNVETGRLLLRAGADINANTRRGNTALHRAAFHNQVDFVELLLDEHGNPNARNADGQTPLHSAIGNGRTDTARLLMERGADITVQDANGQTPLALASSLNSADRRNAAIVALIDALTARSQVPAETGGVPPAAQLPAATERVRSGRKRSQRRER
jgi:cytohesin